MNAGFQQLELTTKRMPIEYRPLVDDTYYRDVKGIFSTAFAKNYDRDTIISAWKGRNKHSSFAFYDTDLKKVIGFAMMHRSNDTMFYLSYIGMSEDVRGKGIGTNIMKGLLKWAANQGCSMSLVPLSGVIPWYESLGFSKTYDKLVLVFHKYGTRKQAKYIKALDEERPKNCIYYAFRDYNRCTKITWYRNSNTSEWKRLN